MRAVLVEDSTVQAAALARMLEADGDIVVVATAADAREAADAVAQHRPDVVTMDLDIPGGGQHAIEQIMSLNPTPILVVSGLLDTARATPAVQALAAGAVEALPKPRVWDEADAHELRRQVRRVGRVPVIRRRPQAPAVSLPSRALRTAPGTGTVLAVAASTGGPTALAALLRGLTGTAAAILLVQHIHPAFVEGFVSWLARTTQTKAVIAKDGARATPGVIHVAPGDCHLRLGRDGLLDVGPEPETLHRPSADELFRSVARHGGRSAAGVLLTGMGEDGAGGLLAIRQAGGHTFAQDEASSAVYGMPRAAQRLGAAETILPLEELPQAVAAVLRRRR